MRAIFRISIITAIMLSLLCADTFAQSEVPYITYNFDFWQDVYYTPAAYIPDGNISGEDIGAGRLNNPQDLFVTGDGKVYIADTGNNRIVVLDASMKQERIVDGFDNNGTPDKFNAPSGVFVTGNNEMYIADTANFRVVALKPDGSLLKIIENPRSEVLSTDFVFSPLKVVVDYADRAYVISKNMFQGIMAFDENSNFTGFTGTIKVNISIYERVWRRLSTKAQRSRQIQFIPTEFTNVDMAPDGFVFATNIDANNSKQSVRRLNPKGQDVIKKKTTGSLSGDLYYGMGGQFGGPSRIIDVAYRGNGIYSILDMTRGRIFTYDSEGNLLYIFGGKGTQNGTFSSPTAIDMKGEKILVLDSVLGEIVTFSATQYGSLINEAVSMRFSGDEADAVEKWKQVIRLDSNFEQAYDGIGKSYLAAGDNKTAMYYFNQAMDREYYSIAFKRYRDDFLKSNLGYVLTIGAVMVLALYIRSRIVKSRRKGAAANEEG